MKVNEKGVKKAKEMIEEGKIRWDEWDFDWAADGDRLISSGGLDLFCLGKRGEKAEPEVKDHWAFPFSKDGENLWFRSLIAVKHRASQHQYSSILSVAEKLIEEIQNKYPEQFGEKKKYSALHRREAGSRTIYGIVAEPDVPDLQGDVLSSAQVEELAHSFLTSLKKGNVILKYMHQYPVPENRAFFVESYLLPSIGNCFGGNEAPGSWVVGVKIRDDALWREIEEGKITGFSMGGYIWKNARGETQHILLEEISLVDKPAVNRTFILKKNAEEEKKEKTCSLEVSKMRDEVEEAVREIGEIARSAAKEQYQQEEAEKQIRQILLKWQQKTAPRKGAVYEPDTVQALEAERDFRKLSDDVYLASVLLGKPPKALRKWAEYAQRLEELQKAMATDQPGLGAEWVPTGFSSDLVEKVRLKLKVANLHEHIAMPTDPFKIPRLTSSSTAYLKAENVAPPASSPGTGQASLDARSIAVYVPVSYELEEDTIFSLLPIIREDLTQALASGVENATINGDDSPTHMDSDVTSANDVRKAWKGYRKLARSSAKVNFNGTITVDNLRAMRASMGIYGVEPERLAWVVSIKGYLQLLNLKDSAGNPVVLTVDKYGPQATLLKGELGRLDGIPIVVSEYVREDLNANGVYDGITRDKTLFLLVFRDGFLYGERRNIQVETFREIRSGTIELVASQRIGFVDRLDASTQNIVSLGYNIPA
ncbi:MAG: phage major capsid protein [bacterium JZ-2024 1]